MRAWLICVGVLMPAWARAAAWCAEPIVAHEWGVQVFDAHGTRVADASPLPAYFHRTHTPSLAKVDPVRGMPLDTGVRKIPVLQFYAAGDDIPLGLEVGFARGRVTAWFPEVDVFGAKPHQLDWQRLTLRTKPLVVAPTDVEWVRSLRAARQALWVHHGAESERFVFYEAATTERGAIVVERGPTSAPGRHHLILRNVSDQMVHDVYVTSGTYRFFAPAIPAHATAGFVLEDHPAKGDPRAELRARLVETGTAPAGPCVMGRNPAVAFDRASDWHLYAHEADALLALWGKRLFESPPATATVAYREDPLALDAMMPLSIYTDMYHFVRTSRVGLALIEGVALP